MNTTKPPNSTLDKIFKWISYGSITACVIFFLWIVFSVVYVVAGMTYPRYYLGHDVMMKSEDSVVAHLYVIDGKTLLDGNVDRISYLPGSSRNIVTVSYFSRRDSPLPHTPSKRDGKFVARIDLRTRTVTDVPDPDGSISRNLQPIKDWLRFYPLNFF